MTHHPGRRQFMRLAAVGGLAYASGLRGWQAMAAATGQRDDFYFVQLSDSHWGFAALPIPTRAAPCPRRSPPSTHYRRRPISWCSPAT